ncbi:hypothetical protein HRbin06_00723 [archaeon HR06]|nr:hypothetical protein HRbin06_00723 [archaeon HR06]
MLRDKLGSSLLVLGSFLFFLFLLNYFKIIYYPTIRRVTYVKVFDATLTGDKLIDIILMLISLGLGILLTKRIFLKRFFSYLIYLLIILEVGALVRWVTYPIYPTSIYGDFSWHFANLEMQIFYAIGLATPFLFVLLFFWWVVKPLFPLKSFDYKFSNKFSNILLFSIILSILAIIYPYLPTVNPSNMSVSVDVIYYKGWVNELKSLPSEDLITYAFSKAAFNGDRPIPLSDS